MLTGDKGATAKEIGVSCGLITVAGKDEKLAGTNNPNEINDGAQVDAEEKYSKEHRIIEFKEAYETPNDLESEAKRFLEETQAAGSSY